ncbi:hypothetical protein [Geothrix oryzae]|uniref:hypothetical protein n=1 Tax=Geothrix oryzae TaxID=2927975 RepID=UPI00257223BB|nr:hypothetical protein [Geothrix oryzae]
MANRVIAVIPALLMALGLRGQEGPSRVGFAVGYASPQELHAAAGIAAGLNVHFNQGTPGEGRLRLEGVSFGVKTKRTSITTLESQGSAWSVGYDWMPGNRNVRGILGIGGMHWSQRLVQQDIINGVPGFRAYGGTKSGFSIVPTLGAQVRINPYLSVEARYVIAANIGNNGKYYFTYSENNEIREMRYFVLGVELRFPKLR